MNASPLIACQNITVRTGRAVLLDNVSFQMQPAERVVIAGPSGAGKSTLLRAIAGLEPLSSGEIQAGGQPASIAARTLIPPHQRRIGMVLQDLGLWPTLSVLGHLLLGRRPPGRSKTEQLAAARVLLDRLGLKSLARRRPGSLSGGEQQRLALGAAMMGEPRLLLLDEPFQALDLVLKERLLTLVSDWAAERSCAVICVTHDVSEAAQIGARRFVVLESARITVDIPWHAMAHASPASSPTLSAWRNRLNNGPGTPPASDEESRETSDTRNLPSLR